jgi:hydroxymethylbilane synthase
VQAAVLEGRADFAVHSAKDLPSRSAEGLVIAAVPERDDPRDALVGSTFEGLPVGGRVGTGAVRRRAQLAWRRPDLTFGELRGNIDTRLGKASAFDAVVVGAAALRRLDLMSHVTEVLEPEVVVPQVGQGALAVECRADDDRTRSILEAADHGPSALALRAERAFLAEVGGGCDLPVGAYARVDGRHIRMVAVVGSGDGRVLLRDRDEGDDPVALGRRLARRLLDDDGGAMLLSAGALP